MRPDPLGRKEFKGSCWGTPRVSELRTVLLEMRRSDPPAINKQHTTSSVFYRDLDVLSLNCILEFLSIVLSRTLAEHAAYFLPKNDMMFPCPALAPDLPFGALTAGFFLGGGGVGSSSENDSQLGSSTVTKGWSVW